MDSTHGIGKKCFVIFILGATLYCGIRTLRLDTQIISDSSTSSFLSKYQYNDGFMTSSSRSATTDTASDEQELYQISMQVETETEPEANHSSVDIPVDESVYVNNSETPTDVETFQDLQLEIALHQNSSDSNSITDDVNSNTTPDDTETTDEPVNDTVPVQNLHLVMVGDSVTRYQYVSLIYYLHTGRWIHHNSTLQEQILIKEKKSV